MAAASAVFVSVRVVHCTVIDADACTDGAFPAVSVAVFEYCAQLAAFCERTGQRPLLALCRAHHGTVLMMRGEWPEAGEGVLPPPRYAVRLRHAGGGRAVEIEEC